MNKKNNGSKHIPRGSSRPKGHYQADNIDEILLEKASVKSRDSLVVTGGGNQKHPAKTTHYPQKRYWKEKCLSRYYQKSSFKNFVKSYLILTLMSKVSGTCV